MEKKKPYRKLSELPKKDVFTTPEGYFDGLPTKIRQRIETGRTKVVPFLQPWQYVGLAAAATISLLITFGPKFLKSDAQTAEDLLAMVPDEACLAYLKNAELEVEDILALPNPELWEEALDDPAAEPELTDEDADMLYEQYGVSPDESLQQL